MAHNMLEGKVVEGNQEQLVSKEVFLKVNGLLKENAQGYRINEENAEIPLKRFMLCGHRQEKEPALLQMQHKDLQQQQERKCPQ